MGVTIAVGVQKGGVGKSTTSAITSYLLSREGKKVLAVDFDSQGNLTQFLSMRNIYDFTNQTVLQAVKEQDARPYIHHITENLHLLPAEDFLSGFPAWLHKTYGGKGNLINTVLRETLAVVKDQYDYIIIDMPPNLGDHTINGLTAADYAVVMLQSEKFCYDALDRYLEFLIDGIKAKTNPDIVLAGILATMNDSRAALDNSILEQAREEYQDLMFQTVIKRRSRIKEYTVIGLQDHTKADKEALEQYYEFIQELKERVQSR
ncbi:ParA family protein (plasmid) [Brevibacillus sp. M2.1A]|uniref:ParA family protein n=1 Tax=Brevibacillus sp. M2.1A TaxID=2738980 RepID=UPI00156B6763|nr:ParA family protein [Brevibacillus sp. M2.1A]MCC8438707.1 ParA family protein [Brevibacillus sp. M2.1A]